MNRLAVLAMVVCGAACGNKNAATTPDPDTQQALPHTSSDDSTDHSGGMVSADKMEEITKDLDRKRQLISNCLAVAVDNKELPKNSHGKVTLELVIQGGKASTVKVVNATLESKSLADCVISHVKEIEFPSLSKPYETSYTYAFEAM
jgi:hypothetical protein